MSITNDLCSLLLRQQTVVDLKIDNADANTLIADAQAKLAELKLQTEADEDRIVRLELAVNALNERLL